jgi:hypothetical protein
MEVLISLAEYNELKRYKRALKSLKHGKTCTIVEIPAAGPPRMFIYDPTETMNQLLMDIDKKDRIIHLLENDLKVRQDTVRRLMKMVFELRDLLPQWKRNKYDKQHETDQNGPNLLAGTSSL